MKTIVMLLLGPMLAGAQENTKPFPEFKMHEIATKAGVLPAVAVLDVDANGKPDIVAVSNDSVAWYENPSWDRHLITGPLKNLNVCIAGRDLDGDKIPELAVGGDWQFDNTTSGGALFLLKSGGDVRQPWQVTTLLEECPTLHRIRWIDTDFGGEPNLVVAPLKGVGSTGPAFQETGVDLFLLRPPKVSGPAGIEAFAKEHWEREAIDQSLHVLHNIRPVTSQGIEKIFAASFEGICSLERREDGTWLKLPYAAGNPQPLPESGAGEVFWKSTGNWGMVATIEPWHGHQVVVYTQENGAEPVRHVVDDSYKGGHVVYFADFNKDWEEDLLAGHRDPGGPENQVGLYIYELRLDETTKKLQVVKHPLDVGGMATEDAVAADINGDGWTDVVAVGRATENIRWYENLGGAAAGE
jgi:hypothetical protein